RSCPAARGARRGAAPDGAGGAGAAAAALPCRRPRRSRPRLADPRRPAHRSVTP
ncbi:hypothetical protein HMPREF0731_0303, partial [Pseudoroseomonas cervicalis ATCC 49957]